MASVKRGENEQQSEETFEFLCSPCKLKGKNTEADKYCADCNDYYCSVCVEFHSNFPALSGHKILDKGESGSKSNLPLAPTERCERHRFKVVEIYCENHDEVGCYTCMLLDHSTCKDKFDIPEYVKNKNTTSEGDQITEDLQKLTERLTEKISVCKKTREKILKSKEDALESLCQFRKEINERFDKLEERTRVSIEERYFSLIQIIEKELRVLQNSKKHVDSALDCFALSGSNPSQRFVCLKKGKLAAKNTARCTEERISGKTETEYCFVKQEKLVKYLEELNNLGNISRKSNDLYVIAKKQTYNIRHTSDTMSCYIISACVLEDGFIVLADSTNKKLKRANRMYSIVDVFDLPDSPWQICLADKETMAVIFVGVKSITLLSIKDKMRQRNKITTEHNCYGIAAAHGKLYVTDSDTSVIVYSMSGTKLNEFSKDQSGQKLFDNLHRLAVSDDGMRIYVIDITYGLVILNKDGTLQGKYNCVEVSYPTFVCVADNGVVFVSSNSSNCILQFTSDGKKLGNIMASDTENGNCLAVCFDLLKGELIVGRPNKDEIDICCVY